MKKAKFEIEFLQPMLANGRPGDITCRFNRDTEGMLVFESRWWHSAISAALKNMPDMKHVSPEDINVALQVRAATKLHERTYFKHDKKCRRVHESIPPGAIVKFEALVADQVSESNLKAILSMIGSYIGMSPFGYKLGFGKFKVLTIKTER
jgi:hypothetical protein